MSAFKHKLVNSLQDSLPGRAAQEKMAPRPIDELRFKENPKNPAKLGGVLVMLFERNGDIYIPLIKRTSYDGHHSGQVSFPGGKFEPSDNDLVETALRETEEEVGVMRDEVEVIGSLTELFIIASNFKVMPSVGFLSQPPIYQIEEREVASVIELNLNQLKDESKKGIEEMTFGKYTIHSPYYDVEGHRVWGATAMMLSELNQVVERL